MNLLTGATLHSKTLWPKILVLRRHVRVHNTECVKTILRTFI